VIQRDFSTTSDRFHRLSSEQRIAAYRVALQATATDNSPVTELVAFYSGSTDAELLRRHLAERLPEHARPSRYVNLDSLPSTPNGKLDRVALNALVGSSTTEIDIADHSPASSDADVTAVISVFHQLLGCGNLHAESNFFTNGGHSLLAMEAVLAIESATGVRVPIAGFFAQPTPNGIAKELHKEQYPTNHPHRIASEHLYPVSQNARPESPVLVVFSASQLAYALVPALGKRCNIYGANVVWLRESGGAHNDASIGDIARRIGEELIDVVGKRTLIVAGSSFPGTVAYEVARLFRELGHTPRLTLLFEPTRIAKGKNRLQLELEALDIEGGAVLPGTWLRRNHPFSARFWQRAKSLLTKVPVQRWKLRRSKKLVRRGKRLPLSLAQLFEEDRMVTLWRGYRPASFEGSIVLFTSEEHDAHLKGDWLACMPTNTRSYKIPTTHARLLNEPVLSTLVVPTVVDEIQQALRE